MSVQEVREKITGQPDELYIDSCEAETYWLMVLYISIFTFIVFGFLWT